MPKTEKIYYAGYENVTTQRLIILPWNNGSVKSMLVKTLERAKEICQVDVLKPVKTKDRKIVTVKKTGKPKIKKVQGLELANPILQHDIPRVVYAIYYDGKGKRHVFINNIKKKEKSNRESNKLGY